VGERQGALEKLVARMRILITGNMGYVGPVLVRHLRGQFADASLIGYDAGFFAHCLAAAPTLPETLLDRQVFGDVRALPADLLDGVDAVVHLAAISNDPMSRQFEAVTGAINFRASVAIAEAAQRAGVRSFVFASSCSVYGASERSARRETDEVQPLTAYARSKIDTERFLERMHPGGMTLTCLRFATACGMSPRLRLDLVLNDFVASALATGRIDVLSDGTPWRPLIDVRDMARAIEWAILRKRENGGPFLSVNVGAGNYQIAALADTVAGTIPGTTISINAAAAPDGRSYQVDFSLFKSLAPAYVPRVPLSESIANLREGLSEMDFRDANFRESQNVRLKVLEAHLAARRLTSDLRWTASSY
jgi:nucleoside-diphosphate-sugar epimerase